MAEIHQITCDGCGADLTYTNNCQGYRLVLAFQEKPTTPGVGAVTLLAVKPPISQAHHFCGLRCLDRWRDANRQKVTG